MIFSFIGPVGYNIWWENSRNGSFGPKNDIKRPNLRFWVVFRSERAVSTIFPPYIMPNGTYERMKKFSDTLPLSADQCKSVREDSAEQRGGGLKPLSNGSVNLNH